MTVDPMDLPTLDGHSPEWPHTWNTAVMTLRMAPGGRRLTWPGAEDLPTVSRARDKIINKKVSRRACAGHAPGKLSPEH